MVPVYVDLFQGIRTKVESESRLALRAEAWFTNRHHIVKIGTTIGKLRVTSPYHPQDVSKPYVRIG